MNRLEQTPIVSIGLDCSGNLGIHEHTRRRGSWEMLLKIQLKKMMPSTIVVALPLPGTNTFVKLTAQRQCTFATCVSRITYIRVRHVYHRDVEACQTRMFPSINDMAIDYTSCWNVPISERTFIWKWAWSNLQSKCNKFLVTKTNLTFSLTVSITKFLLLFCFIA